MMRNGWICASLCALFFPSETPTTPMFVIQRFITRCWKAILGWAPFLLSQATASVTAASASAPRTGRGRTATAPGAPTPACPAWACCAAAGASVCVGSASARSRGPTGPHATNVPPAPTHAPWRSKWGSTHTHTHVHTQFMLEMCFGPGLMLCFLGQGVCGV